MSTVVFEIIGASAASATAVSIVGGFALRALQKSFRHTAKEVVDVAISDLKTVVETRFDKNDQDSREAAQKATALELKLAQEFGGNSGGMRQAINALGTDVATLRGSFEQHLRENGT